MVGSAMEEALQWHEVEPEDPLEPEYLVVESASPISKQQLQDVMDDIDDRGWEVRHVVAGPRREGPSCRRHRPKLVLVVGLPPHPAPQSYYRRAYHRIRSRPQRR